MRNVDRDIHEAYRILAKVDRVPGCIYTSTSPIFKGTNENMNGEGYVKAFEGNKNALTVIASGEQVLNAIYFDIRDIDAFDISRYPEYYLKLKMGAIKAFDYKEYLRFFYSLDAFNQEQFSIVMTKLDPETRHFWESLNKHATSKEIYRSNLFSVTGPDENDAIMRNPHLKSELAYNELKAKLDSANITYYNESIYTLAPRLDKDYDFINLSNIGQYADQQFLSEKRYGAFDEFGKFVKNLRITDNGKVLNYLLDAFRSSVPKYLLENVFTSEEGYQKDYFKGDRLYKIDGVAVYRKVKH